MMRKGDGKMQKRSIEVPLLFFMTAALFVTACDASRSSNLDEHRNATATLSSKTHRERSPFSGKPGGPIDVAYVVDSVSDEGVLLTLSPTSPFGDVEDVQFSFRSSQGDPLAAQLSGESQQKPDGLRSLREQTSWRFNIQPQANGQRLIVDVGAQIAGRFVKQTISVPLIERKSAPGTRCQVDVPCFDLMQGELEIKAD